jgi:phage tail tape-measure protein
MPGSVSETDATSLRSRSTGRSATPARNQAPIPPSRTTATAASTSALVTLALNSFCTSSGVATTTTQMPLDVGAGAA